MEGCVEFFENARCVIIGDKIRYHQFRLGAAGGYFRNVREYQSSAR